MKDELQITTQQHDAFILHSITVGLITIITGQDERQVLYFDNLTPRDRYRKTNLVNCTHSESIYPNALTFTHD